MDKITKIKIDSFLNIEGNNLLWNLHSDVNVLAGNNGCCKSLILNYILYNGRPMKPKNDNISIIFDERSQHLEMQTYHPFNSFQLAMSSNYPKNTSGKFERFYNKIREVIGDDLTDRIIKLRTIVDNVKLKKKERKSIFESLSDGQICYIAILVKLLKKVDIYLLHNPETFLSMKIQRNLLRDILYISPNSQLIVETHSPDIIMDGWNDKVMNFENLVIKE